MKRFINLILPFILASLLVFSGCGQKQEAPVEESTGEQNMSQADYTADVLSREETLLENRGADEDISGLVTKEQLDKNIELAYLIYSLRDPQTNRNNMIYVSDYASAYKERMWEAYLLPEELQNFAVSVNIDGSEEYMVGILKPKESYKLNVYESLKLLKSGYIGSLSDSHTLTAEETFMQQSGDYIVFCIGQQAEKMGTALCDKLTGGDF